MKSPQQASFAIKACSYGKKCEVCTCKCEFQPTTTVQPEIHSIALERLQSHFTQLPPPPIVAVSDTVETRLVTSLCPISGGVDIVAIGYKCEWQVDSSATWTSQEYPCNEPMQHGKLGMAAILET